MDVFERQREVIGRAKQEVLEESSVTIIGLGGLGSVVAHLLARMGVGTLIIQDFDTVEDHNLSRQHLYDVADIGKSKAQSLKEHLLKINPKTSIIIYEGPVQSTKDIYPSEIIVDCVDNHRTRFLIDEFSRENNIPWVHGAAIKEIGSVFFFDPSRGLTYRDIYGDNPKDGGCGEGVLATTTSFVGTLQAQFVLDFLIDRVLPKELLRFDATAYSVDRIKVKKRVSSDKE